MKRLFLIAGLMTTLALAIVLSAMAAANFGGTWVLDKSTSQGLNPRLQGADKVTWTITQDDKTITIDQKVEGGQPPAGGGGGGAGGGGGMGGGRGPGGPPAPAAYKLDGSETTTENGPMKSTFKATWSGNSLELSRTSSFTGQDGTERKSSETRKLALSGDGKTLTANVHTEGGRSGPTDSTLVFNKQ